LSDSCEVFALFHSKYWNVYKDHTNPMKVCLAERLPHVMKLKSYTRVFKGDFGTRFGSLELKIGSLESQVHTGYLTTS